MSDTKELLESARRLAPQPENVMDSLIRRRDRKRRNQRIAAGVVGIAVFVAAVWIVTSEGWLDHSETSVVPGQSGTAGPAQTGPVETGPAVTGPTMADPRGPGEAWYEVLPEKGGGLPPSEAVPSAPKEGVVVAHFNRERAYPHPQFLYVYADGRVITFGWGHFFVTERRLTPEGVELVRSGAIRPWDLASKDDTDVPAAAWEDPKIKPFVPTRYSVCYDTHGGRWGPGEDNFGYDYPSTVIRFFPAPARAILRGELTHGEVEPSGEEDPNIPECSGVTTDEARALVDILYDVRIEDSEGDEVNWELRLMLPHGVRVGLCVPGGCG